MKKQKSVKKRKNTVHPQWATQHRKPGTELRLIYGTYYLYAVRSKYDPVLKRAKKISGNLLGKITEKDGFIVSSKDKLRQKAKHPIQVDKLTTKEVGTQELVLQLAEKQVSVLEEVFGEDAKPLFLFALFRLTEQSPIKNVPFYFMHSFLSEKWEDVSVSDKSISQLLRRVGSNREKIIWHRTKENVTLYLNQALQIAEEKDYLKRVEAGKGNYTMDGFYAKQVHFGTLALINNNEKKTAEDIYAAYKSRTNVESMFDAMKNVVEADKTYMQNDKAMEGWMFVNHIALQCY